MCFNQILLVLHCQYPFFYPVKFGNIIDVSERKKTKESRELAQTKGVIIRFIYFTVFLTHHKCKKSTIREKRTSNTLTL